MNTDMQATIVYDDNEDTTVQTYVTSVYQANGSHYATIAGGDLGENSDTINLIDVRTIQVHDDQPRSWAALTDAFYMAHAWHAKDTLACKTCYHLTIAEDVAVAHAFTDHN